MDRFKTRIVQQQRVGNFGRSAKWSWDVYERQCRNRRIIGCGTTEDEASARDAATRALAGFLETEHWGVARQRA